MLCAKLHFFIYNDRYAMMRECWSEDSLQRPSFTDIVMRLARVIEAHCDPTVSLLFSLPTVRLLC